MQPRIVNIYLKAYGKNRKSESKESIYQAYLISRWVWQKKVNIQKVLEEKQEKKVMSNEEMLRQVMSLNAMFGGKIIEKKE